MNDIQVSFREAAFPFLIRKNHVRKIYGEWKSLYLITNWWEFNFFYCHLSYSSVCYCIIDDFLKDGGIYAGRRQHISSAYLSSADPSLPPVSISPQKEKSRKRLPWPGKNINASIRVCFFIHCQCLKWEKCFIPRGGWSAGNENMHTNPWINTGRALHSHSHSLGRG